MGPISTAALKAAKGLSITGKGAGLGIDLMSNPKPIDVVLDMGSQRRCLQFGENAKFMAGVFFKAKDAPAPAGCP